MLLCISDVLSAEELATAREVLAGADFVDGKASAGEVAAAVKQNEEASASDEAIAGLSQFVGAALSRSGVFQVAVLPKTISTIIFSRYGEGMSYGKHVDAPRMGGVRADVSFTLFLNDPADYEGGELAIEDGGEDQLIKLPAGQMVVYPSTSLHEVVPVTSGVRLCAVGWIRSLIRDPADREILYDLEVVRNTLYQRAGPGREVDLLMRSILNLQRRWMDD